MPTEPTHIIGTYTFQLTGELGTFAPSFSSQPVKDGVEVLTLRLTSPTPATPKRLRLEWRHPVADIHALWSPAANRNRSLPPDWAGGFRSQATSQAPVICLHSRDGRNRLTFAASDALHAIENKAGVHEETAEFICALDLFVAAGPAITEYELSVRLDTRDIPYEEVLRDVTQWWASQPGYAPSPVPEHARLPMYSTWYSMHQNLVPEEVEKQCRIARELGCESVIVDDGWETTDTGRGFAYCGDWQPDRIGQMKELVQRVHEMGMKFLLWYSVPHVGRHSQAFKRFQDKQLYYIEQHGAGILDPRFPEVREYLINVYERAVREWDLDGFKLDFVDAFAHEGDSTADVPGRDHAGLPEAVNQLLTDVMARLRAIKPEIMWACWRRS